jgi:hypothetical protein
VAPIGVSDKLIALEHARSALLQGLREVEGGLQTGDGEGQRTGVPERNPLYRALRLVERAIAELSPPTEGDDEAGENSTRGVAMSVAATEAARSSDRQSALSIEFADILRSIRGSFSGETSASAIEAPEAISTAEALSSQPRPRSTLPTAAAEAMKRVERLEAELSALAAPTAAGLARPRPAPPSDQGAAASAGAFRQPYRPGKTGEADVTIVTRRRAPEDKPVSAPPDAKMPPGPQIGPFVPARGGEEADVVIVRRERKQAAAQEGSVRRFIRALAGQ